MKKTLIISILFCIQGCSLKSEIFFDKTSFKEKIISFDKKLISLRKECKIDDSHKVNFKKINSFIKYSKENSLLEKKIKALNEELDINSEILYVIQAYNMRNTTNQDKKKECLATVKAFNDEYNNIKSLLGYK